MNKKDRVAAVVSIFMLFIGALGGWELMSFMLFILLSYWSYRFIKNDISFLKMKDE